MLIDSLRIHDDKSMRLGERIEVRVAFLLNVSATAAVHQDKRRQTFSTLPGCHVEQIGTRQAVHVDSVRYSLAGDGWVCRQYGSSKNDRGNNRDARN